jgi:hypothetical protein
MSEERVESGGVPEGSRPEAGKGIEILPVERVKSASMLPLIILFHRASELARSIELSLGRLEHAAEAAALAEAVRHLLAEAGDEEGEARWMVRLSEARHWCAVVHDALTCREERD